ncbi:sporulation protein YqfC [Paenibacillus shirakamiensis]|uniref:Sporulation protein YqfC n=1 Tax=Paenibacillus shirakamiensis TaxID=1265935 RepID=A0ABS4JDY9_9BACL|nr:sporulation protein YqfC [Paenibacillus shirakamiensis]MBP1999166.1 sporulation protein YqfC [Paenibacillus shirakamiensis]
MSRFTRKLRKWSVDVLDLPQDLVFDLPRLTMIGNKQLLIENHLGVLHFSSEKLRLEINQGHLEVDGTGLMIKAIMPDEVLIEGFISNIQYLGTGAKP